MKEQAAGLTREYDRLLDEHSKAQVGGEGGAIVLKVGGEGEAIVLKVGGEGGAMASQVGEEGRVMIERWEG